MNLRIANAPVSWGVDYAGDPDNPAWGRVLDGIAAAGYEWIELGPLDYLPTEPEELRAALEARRLRAVATFLFQPLHDAAEHGRIATLADRTCALLASCGATHLVVIDHLSPERMAAAGRPEEARRLDPAGRETLLDGLRRVAEKAAAHGIRPVVHPHAGTYIEYRDEIDDVLGALPNSELGLCIDTGHSAYASVNPVELYLDHVERCEHFHFKDISPTVHAQVVKDAVDFESAVSAGVFCPLGEGVVDFRGLRAALDGTGFSGAATVEQDRDPGAAGDPIADAERSLAYLRDVGLAT
jgi:inosose dehydratase